AAGRHRRAPAHGRRAARGGIRHAPCDGPHRLRRFASQTDGSRAGGANRRVSDHRTGSPRRAGIVTRAPRRTEAAKGPLVRIAGLSAAFLTSNVVRGVIAFGLSLVIGRALGVERFGRWILCTTWASTLTVVVDLGFGVLLARDGARDGAPIGRLLAGALAARLAVAVPLAALMTSLAPFA